MALRRLGPAVTGFPFAGAARAGDKLVLASRNLVPSRLVVYDLSAREVTATVEVPAGSGAWGVGAIGDGHGAGVAYAGQFGAVGTWNLHRLDLTTGELAAIAALDAQYLWGIAVDPADGCVYVVGSPNRVIRWDPVSGLASVVPGMDHVLDGVRSVALTGRTLVIGGRAAGRAVLRTMDLDSGAVRQHSPPELASQSLVYALGAASGWVAAGMQGVGMRGAGIALLRAPEMAVVGFGRLPDEAVVDAVAIHLPATQPPGGDAPAVVAGARRSGALHRLAGATTTRLAVPVERSETRGLFVDGDRAVGVSAAEVVWTLDLAQPGAPVERLDLLQAGLARRPQLAMSLAAEGAGEDRRVHVGGNFTLATHRLTLDDAGPAARAVTHTFVPGEAKDLCVVDGDLLAALYPSGQVLRRRVGRDDFEVLAQLDPDQFRPVSLVHDPARAQVLVATARDGHAGALHAVGLEGDDEGRVRTAHNPFGDGQHPAGIAVDGDVAYLGGSGPRASLLAWDLDAWLPRWRVDGVRPDSGTWIGVAVAGGVVVLLGSFGWWVTVDPLDRTVAFGGRLDDDGGRLLALRPSPTDPSDASAVHAVDAAAGVAAATSRSLWRLDPGTLRAQRLAEGLGSRLWGWPHLAADDSGALYAVAGLDVARITPG